MPPLVVGVVTFPGKLKKLPGAGPLGHIEGLMIELGNISMRVVQ